MCNMAQENHSQNGGTTGASFQFFCFTLLLKVPYKRASFLLQIDMYFIGGSIENVDYMLLMYSSTTLAIIH